MFKKAVKHSAKARIALYGPSGSGKTFTALTIAREFGRVAVIDTERGSASKYADRFDFDVSELSRFHPETYIQAIREAAKSGYDVLVIDSLTHAWNGEGGVLELHEQAAAKSKSGNGFAAWSQVTPLHNSLINAIMQAPVHVIVTMRSKTEYLQTQDGKGKTEIKKVGTAPIQRDGVEYEFDIVGDMSVDNTLIIAKTRCPDLQDGVYKKPGPEFGQLIRSWLVGDPAPEVQAPRTATPPTRQAEPSTTTARVKSAPVEELTDVASYAGKKVRADQQDPDRFVAQVMLAKRNGEVVEALTDDKTIIADTKSLKKGMTVEYTVKPSVKWGNRLEIVSIVPVA